VAAAGTWAPGFGVRREGSLRGRGVAGMLAAGWAPSGAGRDWALLFIGLKKKRKFALKGFSENFKNLNF